MIHDLTAWWDTLELIQKIYWLAALPSTLIFLIQLIMSMTGVDADHGDFDTDFDTDGGDIDHGPGFNLLSPKTIISFIMVFGWSGLTALNYGFVSKIAIAGISISAGLAMMFLTAWLFFLMSKLQQSGTMKINNAIGQTGEVYLTIPGKKKGNGKVQIIVQGALRTLDAVTEEIEDIKTGSHIEVTAIFGEEILVVRKKR